MASSEQRVEHRLGAPLPPEFLDPRHYYAAFVFSQPETRWRDVTLLIDVAHDLDSAVRYWWQPEVQGTEESSQHLVVGVHYPSPAEAAGLTIHDTLITALTHYAVTWDGILPQVRDEYRHLGKSILSGMYLPDGTLLFPERPAPLALAYTLTHEAIQFVAQGMLSCRLSEAELEAVGTKLRRTVNWLGAVEGAIRLSRTRGLIGPDRALPSDEGQIERRAPVVRKVASWPECYDDGEMHLCNQARGEEGIDYQGQLYIRSNAAHTDQGMATTQGLTDSHEHAWEPEFAPDRGDTFERVLAHLHKRVEHDLLSDEERARSETFYRRLFSQSGHATSERG